MERIRTMIAMAGMLAISACAEREAPDAAAKDRTLAEAREAEDAKRAAGIAAAANESASNEAAAATAGGGRWFASDAPGEIAANYGQPDSEAQLSVRCDKTRREMVIVRSVAMADGPVDVRLTNGVRSIVVSGQATSQPMPQVVARVPISDAFVTGLANSNDAIAVQIGDGERFTAPLGEPFRGVFDQCG